MSDHGHWSDSVGAYLLGALPPDELEAFEAHLRDCLSCRRDVRDFRETLAGLKELVGQPPPPTVRTSLLAAVRVVPQLPPDPDGDAARD